MVTRPSEQELSLRPNMRGGNGTVELKALQKELPAHVRLFSRIELAPGCSIGYHTHENETELFYFVSGHGRANDNGEWVEVAPGDSMSTGNGCGHAVENTGDEPLVLAACIVQE